MASPSAWRNPSAKKMQKRHVLMFPFMAQGHIIPFLHLSKLLASRTGFAITMVNTPLNIDALKPTIQCDPSLDIRLAELPFYSTDHGLPLHTRNTISLALSHFLSLMEATEKLQPHFEQLIRMISEEDGCAPLCIISDMFLGWTLDVADMFGIPIFCFFTSGAYGISIFNSLWTHLPTTRPSQKNLLSEIFLTYRCTDLIFPPPLKVRQGATGGACFYLARYPAICAAGDLSATLSSSLSTNIWNT